MSFSGLGIALSLVFGCLLLALVAGLCYLSWCKKRRTRTGIETDQGDDVKGMLYGVCWKTPCTANPVIVTRDAENKSGEPDLELGTGKDLELGTSKDLPPKGFGEEGIESELMRLHNLAGPPRFLFTINEESREDLESEDGKSRGDRSSRKGSRTKSLSDIMVAIDTPFLNPVASSPLKFDSFNKHQGFNPLFESSLESDFQRFRSSPPPKFKFLRDAEEKLYRRLIEEAQRKAQMNHGSVPETEVKDSPNSTMVTEDKDISLPRFINNKEREQTELQQHLPQCPASSSKVLPLASSPTKFRPVEKASMVH